MNPWDMLALFIAGFVAGSFIPNPLLAAKQKWGRGHFVTVEDCNRMELRIRHEYAQTVHTLRAMIIDAYKRLDALEGKDKP